MIEAPAMPVECHILIDDPVDSRFFRFCNRLAWGSLDMIGLRKVPACPAHGGPPAPLHCRACGRPLAYQDPGTCAAGPADSRADIPGRAPGEPYHEPCCEPCAAQLQYLVERAEFLADLQCVIAEVDGEYRAGLDAGLWVATATATAPGPAEEAPL